MRLNASARSAVGVQSATMRNLVAASSAYSGSVPSSSAWVPAARTRAGVQDHDPVGPSLYEDSTAKNPCTRRDDTPPEPAVNPCRNATFRLLTFQPHLRRRLSWFWHGSPRD